jgi:beta-lactamase superfamily II metal-dependent hydrolase
MLFKKNDALLRGKKFSFSVDKLERINSKIYEALLLPDIESEFFPPFHTRSINISSKLLNYNFAKDHYPYGEYMETEFINDIEQGAYYEVPTEILKGESFFEVSEEGESVGKKFFSNYKKDPPFEKKIIAENIILPDIAQNKISELKKAKIINPILYCFNVGQGDFNLFITSNGNPFIIDTNIYFYESLENYISIIKSKLRENNLDDRYIKGLIITHQHIDHIRGSAQLIDSGEFDIEYFIVNNSYDHVTKAVEKLYNAAERISKWINSNDTWRFFDGSTVICFKNPDNNTRNSPDINNSSISLCIRDLENGNLFYLTGDTGYHILENCYKCSELKFNNSVLKVSHHGSITGTSMNYINLVNPNYAFISAGYNRKFNHPHTPTLNILSNNNVNFDVSKYMTNSVRYESTNKGISKTFF